MAEEESTIQTFPDHILLLMFGYLDTVSLGQASRVCRSWYNVSCDATLSHVLDLRRSPLKLKQLWSVCLRKIKSNTTAVLLRGATYNDVATKDKLTVCFLEMLQNKIPNLTCLTLENFDLRDIPLTSLPCNLKTLSLYKSMLTMGWFDSLKFQTFFSQLTKLDLHSCSKISNNDLEALTYLHTITDLNLADCFRISARGIPGLQTNLKRLRRLDFSGCPGVNNVVLYYLSSLPLRYLKLRFCHYITDQGMKNLFVHNVGKTLQFLDIYSCHEVSDDTLEVLAENASALQHLVIGACNNLTFPRVEKLREELPKCFVEFEQQKQHSPEHNEGGGHGVHGQAAGAGQVCRAVCNGYAANH